MDKEEEIDIENMDESTLTTWVEKQIARMKSANKLGAGVNITFYELQNALASYSSVYFSLLVLQNSSRIDKQKKKNDFELWWDDHYIPIKLRENTKELTGSKWCTASELSSMVRRENKEEYLKVMDALTEAELKASFMDHLVDMWKGYSFVLNTLSSNVRAEAGLGKV